MGKFLGRKITNNGYIQIYDSDRGCYLFEHDKVWLDANGFNNLNSITQYKDGSYVIHHKNEIKTDNRLENLQLLTRSEHASYHGKRMSDETRAKLSKANKGRVYSEEIRKKFSEAQKRNPNRSMLGKHHTEETKKKMSESRNKYWNNLDEHTKEKQRKHCRTININREPPNKGIPCSEEQKKQISQTLKDRYRNGYTPPSKGRIFVTNGEHNKQIYPEQLEEFEKLGYKKGFKRKPHNDK